MIVAVVVLVATLNGVAVPIFTGAVFASMTDCQHFMTTPQAKAFVKDGQHPECRPATLKAFEAN